PYVYIGSEDDTYVDELYPLEVSYAGGVSGFADGFQQINLKLPPRSSLPQYLPPQAPSGVWGIQIWSGDPYSENPVVSQLSVIFIERISQSAPASQVLR